MRQFVAIFKRLQVLTLVLTLLSLIPSTVLAESGDLQQIVTELSSYKTRSTGSPESEIAAEFIKERFNQLGLEAQEYLYQVPTRNVLHSSIKLGSKTYPIKPLLYNAITPGSTGGEIIAPVIYVGKGKLAELNSLQIKDSIILLDFDSARNWQTIASFGAKAIIYIGKEDQQSRFFLEEKEELTPLQLPCYWMPFNDAERFFDSSLKTVGKVSNKVALFTDIKWQNNTAKNIYAFLPGTSEDLNEELLIVEAFYDSREFIGDLSPGADAALSIATLIDTAKQFTDSPPARSTLFVATTGHSQALAGMRDIIWSINTRSKELRQEKKRLKNTISEKKKTLALLEGINFPLNDDEERDRALQKALSQTISHNIDRVSRKVMQLRMTQQDIEHSKAIKQFAARRLALKQLSWTTRFNVLPLAQQDTLQKLLPEAVKRYKEAVSDLEEQQRAFKSANSFRSQVKNYDIAAVISLHLSGHGSGIGAFHRGFLYPLKPSINRTGIYSNIADILERAGENFQGSAKYVDTLRPSHLRGWDSWFLDKPGLGGEISSLAGLLGISLVTTEDSRSLWGTPRDTVEKINWQYATSQNELVKTLLTELGSAQKIQSNNLPRDGFAQVTARSNLLLQGELFASYPAAGTTILAYQGLNKYYAIVDNEGYFRIRGFADKKNVLDKLIIEGYRFDDNGQPIWAIDKNDTGKANYRLKILRKSMKTDLIMFTCQQTTIFNLLEPRNFNYMTKIQLFDGRRDSLPRHYWYSRIDTRTSSLCSIFTEPGTPLKLTLSDTVLTTKMILTNSTEEKAGGTGYITDENPTISYTTLHAAKDAWSLLEPRINNLESHGIFDTRIADLKKRGLDALNLAEDSRESLQYSTAQEASARSLALAARVYTEIEKTQKDVLFGVLFYIALFVPFAFVMERFLFNFVNIYKRIVAFIVILVALITVIYNVHPAFDLAYSPLIIILAFFIIGLSFIVTLIIFFRFEQEMTRLQSHANHLQTEEISPWKAFMAAFFLGVSNLRRRKLRTLLTCSTLVILTFTIMSFTTIKSSQKHMKLPFQKDAPYQGILLKRLDMQSLPVQAKDILVSSMSSMSEPAPRVWLEDTNPTRPVHVPLTKDNVTIDVNGLIGLSPEEEKVTGLPKLLSTGRWFTDNDRLSVIIEKNMAKQLGVSANSNDTVKIWGVPFTVIATFEAETFNNALDLDGEPLSPIIFPEEENREISEAEQEALESGDNIQSFQSRYRHIPFEQTIIIPADTLLAIGGKLKNIALRPEKATSADSADTDTLDDIAAKLIDRFSLAIFTGDDDGVWLYNSSDTISYAGVPNIIIPLLISIFIVLNTMISSVYERKGEIAVYTSVGLAPTHVAFLFVAEALAIAVISVVTGYLVAQISASLFSTTALWDGITVNYSSLAGVAAMFLVILVVLISVIYPAKVAAKIAIPDVNRTFSLPEPINNTISTTLPFLLKEAEYLSAGGFLYSYFEAHREVSHGLFSTGNVHLMPENPETDSRCTIGSKVWLAPFDLGIMQDIEIELTPTGKINDHFLEIRIHIHRQSGEVGVWKRINTAFLHELRKQLLIWRSLDINVHKEHSHFLADKIRQNAEEQS